MSSTIAFIGGGNRGRAIIGGLIAQGHSASSIVVADTDSAARAQLVATFGVREAANNQSAVTAAETIVLAVKPQHLRGVAIEIAPALIRSSALVISIAAGITTKSIARWLSPLSSIVRAMPNTPALIGRGATALFATPAVSDLGRANAVALLRAVGTVVWVEEEHQLDTVTALSGSGPAYFFLLIECLERAATALGLALPVARQLALDTAAGATELARTSAFDPATLRAQVTSKGGTTERALQEFAAGGFESLVYRAVAAASQRAQELSQEFGGE